MPGWIGAADTTRIATRLGVQETDQAFTDALAAAQSRIEEATGLIWGASGPATLDVRLDVPVMAVAVPADVSAVSSITPDPGGSSDLRGLWIWLLDSSGAPVPWPAGAYSVSVTRGIATIPEHVVEAVALLTAHLMGVPDPERSRYAALRQGAWAGTLRPSRTGVPEADALLAMYLHRPGGEAL